jgi:hypothetical protein
VLFVLLSVLRDASQVARRALSASGFADDRRRTTDDEFQSLPGSTEIAVANLFIPNKFQVSNESLILAQNQRWRRA